MEEASAHRHHRQGDVGGSLESAARQPPFRPDRMDEIGRSPLHPPQGSPLDRIDTVPETQPASSTQLSLAISELVARSLRGEAIDMPAEGERLAGRYPDLGMTGDMIGSAIGRAIGMVGSIRNGEDPPAAETAVAVAAPEDVGCAAGSVLPDQLANGEPGAAALHKTDGEAAQAAAGDAAERIGGSDEAIPPQSEIGSEPGEAASLAGAGADGQVPAASGPDRVLRLSKGPLAAVRRALFRH